jgi:hypothetical protein
MQTTGYKPAAMYPRYAIVAEADHREAARKLEGIVWGMVKEPVLETLTVRR